MAETKHKLALLRRFLKAQKLDGLVLSTRANFAWLTGGGDNHVVSQGEQGFGAIYVTARQATLLADTIEAPRIANEEPVADLTVKSHPWTTPLAAVLERTCAKKRVLADDPAHTGLGPLPPAFQELRAQLCDAEIHRYRRLGRDCALVVETVARQLSIGDSGHQVEADLARHLLARGIQPAVILVAFDERLKRYRHPIPTANHLRKHAMLVICGQRDGLVASLTRLVHFGEPGSVLRKRHEACCRVEAALWAATVPGARYGAVLKKGIAAYKKAGFGDEWKAHHQGGPTGYAGRDFLVTAEEQRAVLDRQAVAWNPSIAGTKSEDTFVVQGDERTVLTACSPNWPTLTVPLPGGDTLTRPDILVR